MTERLLHCDAKSVGWAYRLGCNARLLAPSGTQWNAFCPFSEGTPHRQHWLAGWKAGR